MQFEFDKDIIGKFCKKEQDKYSNMLAFRRVVGYDFINNVYIVKDIDNFFHTYGTLCPSGMAMPEVYTLDEVFALIDAEIEKGTKIGFSCFKLIRQVWIASQIRLRKKIKSPSRI